MKHIYTCNHVPGETITAGLGMVRGSSVRARHMGRDLGAFFKGLVGGEVDDYTKLLAEAREQALDRMIEEARALGADAIVGMRFCGTEIQRGAAEMLAYGTAVRLEKD